MNIYIDIGKIRNMIATSTKNNNVTLTRRTWILIWMKTAIWTFIVVITC